MNRRMKTTWSVDNIEVKDNFMILRCNSRHLVGIFIRLVQPSSQLKGSLSLLFKALHHSGQILTIRTIREQIFGKFFVLGGWIIIWEKLLSRIVLEREMNCGTKLYSIVRGKKGNLDMICFFIVFIAVVPVRIQL